MKRFVLHIIFGLLSLSCFIGCDKFERDLQLGGVENRTIAPYCKVENTSFNELSIGNSGTKALINQNSTPDSIFCNFLRIDEMSSGEFATADYVTNWLGVNSYISEGAVSTIPDATSFLRTVSLHPAQPYKTIAENGETKNLKSRMVGWYPRTCDLPKDITDEEAVTQSDAFASKIVTATFSEKVGDNVVVSEMTGVKFTGLDGSKDIMVSDVRDGAINSDFSQTNAFNFKHYLSAVKVYAKAHNSSQDIGIWGEISNVRIVDQPTSCIVALPTTTGTHSNSVIWGDRDDFPIVTTPVFGNDVSESNKSADPYPIKLEGSATEKYLGYSLIQPNHVLKIMVNTSAGFYNVLIDPSDPAYSGKNIFQPGYIYKLHLNFNTDGTVMVYIENEDDELFYDLTTGRYYTPPAEDSNISGGTSGSGQTNTSVIEYHYANCYIINPEPKSVTINNVTKAYAGFCFDATVAGNGAGGILSDGAQTFYPLDANLSPVSADLLWETSPRLIHQVELLFGYVRFKVAKDSNGNFKKGNAVIAVYDENRTILWSWHIWITDQPQELSYNTGEKTLTILDRNIGATAATWTSNSKPAEVLATYGLYYQWGRKDSYVSDSSNGTNYRLLFQLVES